MNSSPKFMKLLLQVPEINVNILNNDGDSALQICCGEIDFECIKMLLTMGADTRDWKTWVFYNEAKDDFIMYNEAVKIMRKWRSCLPEWSIFTHKLYPLEFEELAVLCIMCLNKLQFCKDIRLLLIKYVAKDWRKISD